MGAHWKNNVSNQHLFILKRGSDCEVAVLFVNYRSSTAFQMRDKAIVPIKVTAIKIVECEQANDAER